ncbi:GIY-YIG nuclease family protein [Pseudomonas atacamensis]|uniref:GIY-YIG nuclease family protein n=1 Tax=Pseudomonas atacamensis TaxID=2565368 RepID=UPI00215F8049|nr:GIY-YIG nuclease family protein [Pseudomonas atacamensis]UVK96120.1 GIY-YIG nuclease family protein [Pseudomonas atacamensis]
MKVTSWEGWEPEWLKLTENFQNAPSLPGVYIICTCKNIQRVVGIDEYGVLTIGESDNLRRRLSAFMRCASNAGKAGHMAGWRFSYFSFEKVFPLETLWVSWIPTANKAAAYAKEGEMLALYLAQHFELPPLNYKFNWPKLEA